MIVLSFSLILLYFIKVYRFFSYIYKIDRFILNVYIELEYVIILCIEFLG